MNIQLLRRVKNAILKHPEHFDMESWFSYRGTENPDFASKLNPTVLGVTLGAKPSRGQGEGEVCGTTACIAGWCVAVSSKKSVKAVEKEMGESFRKNNPGFIAAKLLGTSCDDFNEPGNHPLCNHPLFFEQNWPEKFETKFKKARTRKEKARVAADRIEHFIQTGE